MTFDSLSQFGRKVDLGTLLSFEGADYFRCYNLEITPSIGANVHMLGALRNAGLGIDHPSITKITEFLRQARRGNSYWLDKWHTSPYYITSHAIISLKGVDDGLCRDAVEWILDTRNENGAWGYYGQPTAEETAYCIQALKLWEKYGGKIPAGVVEGSEAWLSDHVEPPYPPLWISKALYCPELVVRTTILCALAL